MLTPLMRVLLAGSSLSAVSAVVAGLTGGGFTTVLVLVALGVCSAGLFAVVALVRDEPPGPIPPDEREALPAPLRATPVPLGLALSAGVMALGLALDWWLFALAAGAAVALAAVWSVDTARRNCLVTATDRPARSAAPPPELTVVPNARLWLKGVDIALTVAAAVTMAVAFSKDDAPWVVAGITALALVPFAHAVGTWLLGGAERGA